MLNRNKTIMVTGCAGFIGSHLTDRLVAEGYRVIGIDNLVSGKLENVNSKCELYDLTLGNLTKKHRQVFQTLCLQVDSIFHLAAQSRIQPSITNPYYSHDTNTRGILDVLWEGQNAKVRRVIYTSSSSIYGNAPVLSNKLSNSEWDIVAPKTPYSAQKLLGEQYCRIFNQLYGKIIDTVSLRLFNVYGERQVTIGTYATVIGIFLKQFKEKKPLTIVGLGDQRRDFTYVLDIVDGLFKAFKRKLRFNGAVINLGTGTNYLIQDVANMISSKQTYIPARLGEVPITLANNLRAEMMLKWRPRTALPDWIAKQLK